MQQRSAGAIALSLKPLEGEMQFFQPKIDFVLNFTRKIAKGPWSNTRIAKLDVPQLPLVKGDVEFRLDFMSRLVLGGIQQFFVRTGSPKK